MVNSAMFHAISDGGATKVMVPLDQTDGSRTFASSRKVSSRKVLRATVYGLGVELFRTVSGSVNTLNFSSRYICDASWS